MLFNLDTEGSFVIERVVEIAEAVVHHLLEMTQNRNSTEQQFAQHLTVEEILAHIYYYRIHDYVEQIALVNVLPSILYQYSSIKLIIIDSVTFHFRHDFTDMSLRTRLLNTMAQNLTSIAEQFNLAVVLMNQMTTKVNDKENESLLVPALGESWGHSCTNRVILYWKEGQRYAHLSKSPDRKSDIIPFTVTEHGIR